MTPDDDDTVHLFVHTLPTLAGIDLGASGLTFRFTIDRHGKGAGEIRVSVPYSDSLDTARNAAYRELVAMCEDLAGVARARTKG